MPADRLPEDGELRLGSVVLPDGQRRALRIPARKGLRVAEFLPSEPVVWVTNTPVADPGGAWSALSDMSGRTGLMPFLAAPMRSDQRRPWDSGEFNDPEDMARLDHIDAAAVLKHCWDNRLSLDPAEYEDSDTVEWVAAQIAPFGRDFPGLAAGSDEPLDPAPRYAALAALRPARIGLAVADRPADVLPAIGWGPGNWIDGALPVAAVVRSWEERSGARLLEVAHDAFTLLVERPPRTLPPAQRLAAEQFAFADECSAAGQVGMNEVGVIAPCLVTAPTWGFWWD